MGCWDETCSLSHIGITERDPVVRVRLETKKLHIDMLPLWHLMHNWDNDTAFYCVHDIMDGQYDDYGGLEESDRDDGVEDWNDYLSLFFHKQVWDEGQKIELDRYWDLALEESNFRTLHAKPRIREFIKITRYATLLRVPLLIPASGSQSWWDSDKPRRAMIKLQLALLTQLKNKYK